MLHPIVICITTSKCEPELVHIFEMHQLESVLIGAAAAHHSVDLNKKGKAWRSIKWNIWRSEFRSRRKLFTVATGVPPILKEQTFIHLFILCCSWTWGQGWGEKMWIKENLIKTGRCGCHHHLKLSKIGNKLVCIGYKGIRFFLLLASPFAADLATQYRGSSRVLVWFKIWFQRLFFYLIAILIPGV